MSVFWGAKDYTVPLNGVDEVNEYTSFPSGIQGAKSCENPSITDLFWIATKRSGNKLYSACITLSIQTILNQIVHRLFRLTM